MIPAGNMSANYTITITNDVVVENSETFYRHFKQPISWHRYCTNAVHTYTIRDDDNPRRIFFDASTSNGSEGTTMVNIGISINNADAFNLTAVDYAVTGGTATAVVLILL